MAAAHTIYNSVSPTVVARMDISAARLTVKALAGAALSILIVGGAPVGSALAQSPGLEGSWSGGGKIVFPSGESESARCRVNIRRQSSDSFGMNAVCATASARVLQSAELTRVSGNRFQGEFFNKEYGISGSIRVTVNGNRLNASLSGGGGTAQMALSR